MNGLLRATETRKWSMGDVAGLYVNKSQHMMVCVKRDVSIPAYALRGCITPSWVAPQVYDYDSCPGIFKSEYVGIFILEKCYRTNVLGFPGGI